MPLIKVKVKIFERFGQCLRSSGIFGQCILEMKGQRIL